MSCGHERRKSGMTDSTSFSFSDSFTSEKVLDNSDALQEFQLEEDERNSASQTKVPSKHDRENINQKIKLLHEMNKSENKENDGMVLDTSAMELNSIKGALYAKTLTNLHYLC
jgi:hypothetical protein